MRAIIPVVVQTDWFTFNKSSYLFCVLALSEIFILWKKSAQASGFTKNKTRLYLPEEDILYSNAPLVNVCSNRYLTSLKGSPRSLPLKKEYGDKLQFYIKSITFDKFSLCSVKSCCSTYQ